MAHPTSFFQKRQKMLLILSSLYVFGIVIFHWHVPTVLVWGVAAFFSIAMNFTYLTEAYNLKSYFRLETSIAACLIISSILGVILSPVFVIAAILGHGIWDIAKHNGAGVPFLRWYTLGCFWVDMFYGAALGLYWWGQ